MTTRTREWTKFGVLVALALVLALGFAAAVDFPRASQAQQRPVTLQVSERPVAAAAEAAVALGDAFVAVAAAVEPSVVHIRADRRVERSRPRRPQLPPPFDDFFQEPGPDDPGIRRGQGSGFIISADGYILTNNHVVEDADRLKVTLLDKREFPAEVVGRDPDTDVAIIKIDAGRLRPVSLGNSDSLRIGEWVLAVGNPLEFRFSVTAGIVSAKGRLLAGLTPQGPSYRIHDFIQTDAAINPGNSGGPLVNVYGQVVGMNAAIASATGFFQGYGFAIPINLARTVSEQLIAHGRVSRAILGVQIRDADPEDAAYVGLKEIRGVVITSYSGDNSPAKAAGLQPGDVIVEVDGQPVEYGAQLQQLIGFKRPGQEAKVTVVRKGGARQTFTVRLAAREDDTQQIAASGRGSEANRRPYEVKLGMSVEPVAREAAARAQLDEEQIGLVITRVDPEGPAGDKPQQLAPQLIITHVNGHRVRTIPDLERAVAPVQEGEIVELRLYDVRAEQPNLVRLRAGGNN